MLCISEQLVNPNDRLNGETEEGMCRTVTRQRFMHVNGQSDHSSTSMHAAAAKIASAAGLHPEQ